MNFKEIGWERGTDLCGSEHTQVVGFCEHGNETSAGTKSWQFLN
jgi:hypothetical protein